MSAFGLFLSLVGSVVLFWTEWKPLLVPAAEVPMFSSDKDRTGKRKMMSMGFLFLVLGNVLQLVDVLQ